MGCLEIWSIEQNVDYAYIREHFYSLLAETLLHRLETGETFSYINLGDLEWNVINKRRGNIEHDVFADIYDRLVNVVKTGNQSNLYVSFSEKLFKTEHVYSLSKTFLESNNINYLFVNADIFNNMLRYETKLYFRFMHIMDTSFPNSIVHIGNEHINNLMPIIFAPLARVIVPKRNCYSEYDWIKQEI